MCWCNICTSQYLYLSYADHANFQNKVDTLQDNVITLQDTLDTIQNITETSTRQHLHTPKKVELQNTSCTLDGKSQNCSQAPTLQNDGGAWCIYQVHDNKDRHRPDLVLRENYGR